MWRTYDTGQKKVFPKCQRQATQEDAVKYTYSTAQTICSYYFCPLNKLELKRGYTSGFFCQKGFANEQNNDGNIYATALSIFNLT